MTRGGIRALRLVDPPGAGAARGARRSRAATRPTAQRQTGAARPFGPHAEPRGDPRPPRRCRSPRPSARRAGRVFERLAAAEARVHGRSVEDVRLHEAGGGRRVFDVVGVCLALEALGIERVELSAVPMGGRERGGRERAMADGYAAADPGPSNGRAPAGSPVSGPPPFGEATTPTGAALVTTLADRFGSPSADADRGRRLRRGLP